MKYQHILNSCYTRGMNSILADRIRQQRQGTDNNASALVELLAVIAIGLFGMFLAEVGSMVEDPIFYWSGIVASISAAGYITMKFLTAVWDFIDRFKKKSNQ